MQSDPHDVIVVGGSYAGLSAALALARARKRVLVIDAGQRRNRFVRTAHNLLGQDGRAPEAIVRSARAEVAAYPTATFVDGVAVAAAPNGAGFTVTLEDGSPHPAARLILATGVEDELPDLPGLREGWGRWVFHCPYCHGYEVAGRRLGVLAFGAAATHLANLIPEWGPTTFLTNGAVSLTASERDALEGRGVVVEETGVSAVINGEEGMEGVRLDDGRVVGLDALFITVGGEDHAVAGVAGQHAVVGGVDVGQGAGFGHGPDSGQGGEAQGFLDVAGGAGGVPVHGLAGGDELERADLDGVGVGSEDDQLPVGPQPVDGGAHGRGIARGGQHDLGPAEGPQPLGDVAGGAVDIVVGAEFGGRVGLVGAAGDGDGFEAELVGELHAQVPETTQAEPAALCRSELSVATPAQPSWGT